MTDWTEAETATLTKGWAAGRSAGSLMDDLKGRSRNSIIGKVHRLGLPTRSSLIRKPPPPRAAKPRGRRRPSLPTPPMWDDPVRADHAEQRREAREIEAYMLMLEPRPSSATKPVPAVPEPFVARWEPSQPITFAQLRSSNSGINQCRFIAGEVTGVETTLYCGAQTIEGSAYCLEHHKLCRVTVAQARQARLVRKQLEAAE